MELKGTVLNVVDFGAFVDIGLKDSGLVHISQLANRYIKSPHDVVSVGDVVTVWVMGVDHERKRVSLTMVKPGTERPRGAAGRRAARRERARPARVRGRARAGGTGPRPRVPAARALTSPPVGAASIAALAEPPRRRPERDRGERGADPADRTATPGPARAGAAGRAAVPTACGAEVPGPAAGPWRAPRRAFGHGPGPGGRRPGPGVDRPAGPGPGPAAPPVAALAARPPPPLSKDALTGSVPLRTFGQLKQLWEARRRAGR